MQNKISDYLAHRVESTVAESTVKFVTEIAEMFMIGQGRNIEDVSFSLSSLSAAVSHIVMFELLGDPQEGPHPLTEEYLKYKDDFVKGMKIQLSDAARDILKNGGSLTDEDIEKMIFENGEGREDKEMMEMLSKIKKFDA